MSRRNGKPVAKIRAHRKKKSVDWKKKNDAYIYNNNGGDRLIRPALVMLFGEGAKKTRASFYALAPLRKKKSHLDQAVARFLVGRGYVGVSSAKATSCELTKKGRKVLLSGDTANSPKQKPTARVGSMIEDV